MMYDNEHKTKASKNLMGAKTEPKNTCLWLTSAFGLKLFKQLIFPLSKIHYHDTDKMKKEKERKARLVSFVKFQAQYHYPIMVISINIIYYSYTT